MIISQRNKLNHEEIRELSRKMVQQLVQSPLFKLAKRIALYLPVRGEADPVAVMHHPLARFKTFYLPVVDHLGGIRMHFAPWSGKQALTRNRFGIPEPDRRKRRPVPPRQLDLVITPLVGFDREGHRLGMGGGYYDRTFAFKLGKHGLSPPFLLGFAYDFQQLTGMKPNRWDVRLDGIVTPSGLKRFSAGILTTTGSASGG